MSLEEVELLEYQIEYPTLNLVIKKDNKRMFDYGMLYCYTKECEKGFKVKKVNKTTKKGTKFTYTAIKNKQDFEEYKKMVNEMIDNFNMKHGSKIKAQ
ncbi:hypothetical protein [Clostridium cavendishii]|uniref:hypothetical protein n=1 Tax=Clostridium cavendishii TaxID=349931 RepID=UPI000A007D54|nr:hypothetical protein [Clostridium cavendishii]